MARIYSSAWQKSYQISHRWMASHLPGPHLITEVSTNKVMVLCTASRRSILCSRIPYTSAWDPRKLSWQSWIVSWKSKRVSKHVAVGTRSQWMSDSLSASWLGNMRCVPHSSPRSLQWYLALPLWFPVPCLHYCSLEALSKINQFYEHPHSRLCFLRAT